MIQMKSDAIGSTLRTVPSSLGKNEAQACIQSRAIAAVMAPEQATDAHHGLANALANPIRLAHEMVQMGNDVKTRGTVDGLNRGVQPIKVPPSLIQGVINPEASVQ